VTGNWKIISLVGKEYKLATSPLAHENIQDFAPLLWHQHMRRFATNLCPVISVWQIAWKQRCEEAKQFCRDS